MLKIPITTKFESAEADVVVTIRGMEVRRDSNTGEARVVLDDYDVHYTNGAPVSAEVLDGNDTLELAVEELIEDCILPLRPAPPSTFRPRPNPADGQVAEAAA